MVPNAGPQVEVPASVAPAKAQAPAHLPAGVVEGLVAMWDGQDFVPVAGATLRVEGTKHAATTDAEGRYHIEGLAPGGYRMIVSKDGFAASESRMVMGPVSGTPRVNMALSPATYSVQQIAAFTATVTGVVTDPRGSALPGATIKLLCNVSNNGAGSNATETTNVNGFYAHTLADVSANSSSPGQVQASAYGLSPGQVRLETSNVTAANLTSSSLVLNVQTDAYPTPGTPTWPNGTYSVPGTIATLNATQLSQRADEFHVRLTSGTMDYDLLPDSVAT
ncbi:MAG: carboxypeptidase-like regulatory domain-containing protein, partial [Candidatus Sericytochromatia bacterium]